MADLNLDGRTDLVVVNGGFRSEVPNKIPDTEVVTDDSPSLYLGDGRGTFADVWPELGLDARGGFRGLALGDLDQDGDTDIVIVDQFDGLRVFRNDTEGPSLTLRPPRACDPAGVRVAVTVGVGRHEQLFGAHTIFGAHAREVIVGTAGAERARVSIDRPGATPRGFAVDLPAGRRIVRDLRVTVVTPAPAGRILRSSVEGGLMYGTIARVKVKQGRMDDLVAIMDEWDREFKPKVDGAMGGYMFKLDKDPSEAMMVAVFRDKASYTANADNPEQDKWYQRMRECLDADPEWSDGEIVQASL